MPIARHVLFCVALFIGGVPLINAEVVFERVGESRKMTIKLVGDVDGNMLQYFRSYLDYIAERDVALHMNTVQLDSPGGDVRIAMELGRLIRGSALNTYIDPAATCASACVLILMGGVERMPFGRVSVHRSSLADINKNMAQLEIEAMIAEDSEILRAYTREMGLSPLVADAMNTTPSWAFRTLEPLEMRRWGLEGMMHSKEVALSLFAGTKLKMSASAFNTFMANNWTTCRTSALRFQKSPLECLTKRLVSLKRPVS